MKDENKTNAPAPKPAPAVPKPAPKPRDPFIRAENEDDDGYDPYSDRASSSSKPTPGVK